VATTLSAQLARLRPERSCLGPLGSFAGGRRTGGPVGRGGSRRRRTSSSAKGRLVEVGWSSSGSNGQVNPHRPKRTWEGADQRVRSLDQPRGAGPAGGPISELLDRRTRGRPRAVATLAVYSRPMGGPGWPTGCGSAWTPGRPSPGRGPGASILWHCKCLPEVGPATYTTPSSPLATADAHPGVW